MYSSSCLWYFFSAFSSLCASLSLADWSRSFHSMANCLDIVAKSAFWSGGSSDKNFFLWRWQKKRYRFLDNTKETKMEESTEGMHLSNHQTTAISPCGSQGLWSTLATVVAPVHAKNWNNAIYAITWHRASKIVSWICASGMCHDFVLFVDFFELILTW